MTTDRVPQQQPQPMSRRDVWLTVALAVAEGRIDAPDELEIYAEHEHPSVELLYRAHRADSYSDAARAADALGVPFDRDSHDTIRVWWDNRPGWVWAVRAYRQGPIEPESSALAEEVAAAITGATS